MDFRVAQMVKRLPTMQETQVRSLGQEDPLEKEMATHLSTLAWKIPRMEKPSRLQSMGSQRVRHSLGTKQHRASLGGSEGLTLGSGALNCPWKHVCPTEDQNCSGNTVNLLCNIWRVVCTYSVSACYAGDLGSISGSGRSPGGGHGNPLQYSCLENPRVRRAWWATVHRVTKRRTQLKWEHMCTVSEQCYVNGC